VRIPVLTDKPIGLIKWRKAGLESLLVSPYLERRTKGRAIRDYRRGEQQNPPYPFNIATTLHPKIILNVEGYGLKASIRKVSKK
jgi:hypothetical protein